MMSVPVAQKPHIRPCRLFARMLNDSFYHSSFGRLPQYAMIRKVRPAKKINARSKRFENNFVWMHLKMQITS
jgi:hypothetical protein